MEEQAPGLQPGQFPVSVPLWGFVFVVDLFVFLFVGPVCLSVCLALCEEEPSNAVCRAQQAIG